MEKKKNKTKHTHKPPEKEPKASSCFNSPLLIGTVGCNANLPLSWFWKGGSPSSTPLLRSHASGDLALLGGFSYHLGSRGTELLCGFPRPELSRGPTWPALGLCSRFVQAHEFALYYVWPLSHLKRRGPPLEEGHKGPHSRFLAPPILRDKEAGSLTWEPNSHWQIIWPCGEQRAGSSPGPMCRQGEQQTYRETEAQEPDRTAQQQNRSTRQRGQAGRQWNKLVSVFVGWVHS